MTRIVLLLLLGGGLALFVLSNLSLPVLPLVFLGMETPALPLTVWIGIAIAAGAMTSFVLQLLSYLQRVHRPLEAVDQEPPRTRWQRDERFEREVPEPETPYTPPPPNASPQTPTSDWEETMDKDWNFQDESASSYREEFNRDRFPETPESDRQSYDVKQQPASGHKNGSVYSYSYRDAQKSGVGKPDVVYDANYRVITPPYQKPPEPEQEDEEEDWGFEDDEDFDLR